jgi:hypothetical protein
MARAKDVAQQGPPQAGIESGAPAPVAPPPGLPEGDLAELERLRRENAVLRGQLAAPPTGLATAPGAPRKYRVKLEGMKPLLTALAVEARPGAPPALRELPAGAFRVIDLFNDGQAIAGVADEAWKRYAAEHGLTPTDRHYFTVQAEGQGPRSDHLDVVAASPADAFERFKQYNGVQKTTAEPTVVLLEDEARPPSPAA